MSVSIAVQISEEQARRLREVACTREMSEDAVIADALEMLFYDFEIEQEEKADLEYVRELEAEIGPLPPRKPAKPINPEDITFSISKPIPGGKYVRRIRWKNWTDETP